MKVFVAALIHETNSFSPFETCLDDYVATGIYRPRPGDGIDDIESHVGYVDLLRAAEAAGHEVVRGLSAKATPAGPTRKPDYESLRDELLANLKSAMPVDMVLLMLHGAQVADGYDDCEGDLIWRARAIVGADIPIGVELDLHCSVTDRMVRNASLIAACKEYPHTDFAAVATQIFSILSETAEGSVVPTMAHVRIPMLSLFHTPDQPFRDFIEQARRMEGRDGVLSITLGHGFPWADVPDVGAHVIVVTNNDPEQARSIAKNLASQFFELRNVDIGRYLKIDEALDEALAAQHGPVIIADASDNPGGGAAGDATFILHRMSERAVRDAAIGMIWDPQAVEIATSAGIGSVLKMPIGGKTGTQSGSPIEHEVTVIGVSENLLQRRPGDYPPFSMGAAAAVETNGLTILLASVREQTFAPECFTGLGVDPVSMKILVVKSSQHFCARFAPIASEIIYCDAPGARTVDFARLPYQKIRRPIWPIDELPQWHPS